MPLIDDLLDEFNEAKWFTKVDLRTSYHQIRVVVEDVSTHMKGYMNSE